MPSASKRARANGSNYPDATASARRERGGSSPISSLGSCLYGLRNGIRHTGTNDPFKTFVIQNSAGGGRARYVTRGGVAPPIPNSKGRGGSDEISRRQVHGMGFDGFHSRDTACVHSPKPGSGFIFERRNQLSNEIYEQTAFNGITEGFHASEQQPPGRAKTTPARVRAISPKPVLVPRARPISSQQAIRYSRARTFPLSRSPSVWSKEKHSPSTRVVHALDFLFCGNDLGEMERRAPANIIGPDNRTKAVLLSISDRVQYAIGREKIPDTSIREHEDAINKISCIPLEWLSNLAMEAPTVDLQSKNGPIYFPTEKTRVLIVQSTPLVLIFPKCTLAMPIIRCRDYLMIFSSFFWRPRTPKTVRYSIMC